MLFYIVALAIIVILIVIIIVTKRRWGCENVMKNSRFKAGGGGDIKLRTGKCVQTNETGAGTYLTKDECNNSQVCLVPQKFKCNSGTCLEAGDGTYITHPTPEGGDVSAYSKCQSECNQLDSGTYSLKAREAANDVILVNAKLRWRNTESNEPTTFIYNKNDGTLYINDPNTPGYLSVDTTDFPPVLSPTINDLCKGWTIYRAGSENKVKILWMGKDGPIIRNGWTLVSSASPPLFMTNAFTQTVDPTFIITSAHALRWTCQTV